ncbi:acid-soluble spore protein N [Thalassobacillus hwangdonensis]|uniref:Small, acid-soluble spore protein N n=1 Tax=Thalassobacillus hwangdonensis TaxID=546108 RepID=A0ABW3L146_9BACI
MGNPKKNSKRFTPDHSGTQSRESDVNKGKQMEMKTDKAPKLIQTKGK